jgi:hypothetical protein
LHQKNASKSPATKLDYFSDIKEHLKKNAYLLKNYHTKTEQSQKILLDSLQEFFVESKFNITGYGSKFGFLDACYVKVLLHLFKELEILNDDLTIEWYKKQKKSLQSNAANEEGRRHAINKLEAFMNWLEESESSDEDEE